jgi:hypothetical protein
VPITLADLGLNEAGLLVPLRLTYDLPQGAILCRIEWTRDGNAITGRNRALTRTSWCTSA